MKLGMVRLGSGGLTICSSPLSTVYITVSWSVRHWCMQWVLENGAWGTGFHTLGMGYWKPGREDFTQDTRGVWEVTLGARELSNTAIYRVGRKGSQWAGPEAGELKGNAVNGPGRGILRSRVWSAVSRHKGGEWDEAYAGLSEFLVMSQVSVKWWTGIITVACGGNRRWGSRELKCGPMIHKTLAMGSPTSLPSLEL